MQNERFYHQKLKYKPPTVPLASSHAANNIFSPECMFSKAQRFSMDQHAQSALLIEDTLISCAAAKHHRERLYFGDEKAKRNIIKATKSRQWWNRIGEVSIRIKQAE